jgi:hypothetical protein
MEDRNTIDLRLSRLRTQERRNEQYEQVEEAYPAQSADREQSDASEQDCEENAGLGFGGFWPG